MAIEPLTLQSAVAEAEAYALEMNLRPRRPVEIEEPALLPEAMNEPAD